MFLRFCRPWPTASVAFGRQRWNAPPSWDSLSTYRRFPSTWPPKNWDPSNRWRLCTQPSTADWVGKFCRCSLLKDSSYTASKCRTPQRGDSLDHHLVSISHFFFKFTLNIFYCILILTTHDSEFFCLEANIIWGYITYYLSVK